MMAFFVAGEPIPKGSTRAFVVKGKPIITNANRRTKDWEMRIATEAQAVCQSITDGAVTVSVVFVMQRPKSLPKRIQHHMKRPDIDKLLRAVLDGITGIVIRDDSQVVGIFAQKRYAQVGERTGADVTVEFIPTSIIGRGNDD